LNNSLFLFIPEYFMDKNNNSFMNFSSWRCNELTIGQFMILKTWWIFTNYVDELFINFRILWTFRE
jgi:hypothetical protein